MWSGLSRMEISEISTSGMVQALKSRRASAGLVKHSPRVCRDTSGARYPSRAPSPANPTSAPLAAPGTGVEERIEMAPRKKQGETPHLPFVSGVTEE